MSKKQVLALFVVAATCAACIAASEGKADKQNEPTAKKGAEAKELYFQILEEKRLGYRHVRSTKTKEQIVLEESVKMTYRDTSVSYETKVTYSRGDKPQPVRAEAKTFVGDKKLMEGTLEFVAKAGEDGKQRKVVKLKSTGFASRRGEEFDPPKQMSREMTCPDGWLMFPPALFCLVPEMEPKESSLSQVVSVEFPDDLEFDELVNMKKGFALTWSKAGENGTRTITMAKPNATRHYARLVLDADGKITECQMDGMVMRACSKEEALKPVAPKEPKNN